VSKMSRYDVAELFFTSYYFDELKGQSQVLLFTIYIFLKQLE
jgi:hypothetical protein